MAEGWCRFMGMHVMGAVGLVTALVAAGKMNPKGTVLYVSSEAVTGVKSLAFPKAVVPETTEGLQKVMLGSYFPAKAAW